MTASTDHTYNGWTNWDTWNTSLWLDNEYETYQHIRRQIVGDGSDHPDMLAFWLDSNALELLTMSGCELDDRQMPDGIDLTEVNWTEIAEMMLSE